MEQPLVRALDLPAIPERLGENAKLVADAIAHAGNVQRGQRVEETGRQPPQAAVAQPRFRVEGNDIVQGQALFSQRLARQVPGLGIEHILGQLPP